jgi:glycerate dehydrogenase
MKIVVLDGFTLNPGDLDWSPLQRLGDCLVFDRTPPALVRERGRAAEFLLTNKTPIDATALAGLPTLRYIGVLATGVNIVDVAGATRRRIPVTNVPAYSTDSVAQLVFAHVLHHLHDVGGHSEGIRRGRWSASLDFSYSSAPLRELAGRTLGIFGFGRIGHATARIALAFGMVVIATDPSPEPVAGVRFVGVDELFRESDVLTLHAPLTDATRGIVSRERIALMKPTAILINTSRGPLVDEAALAEALASGNLGGAGLDVLSAEPPSPDNPVLHAPRCSITPHIAWATREARIRLLAEATENVRSFAAGIPRNVVNPEALV